MIRARNTQRSAFTLVELLVVIGIIAVLISILLPSLMMVRKQAKATVCMSNLRQIGAATLMYANDNKQWLPAATESGGTPGWWKVEVSPYINKYKQWTTMQKDPYFGEKGPFACPDWAGVSAVCQPYYTSNPGMFGGLVWSNNISYRGDTKRARFRDFKNGTETALAGDGLDVTQYAVATASNVYEYLYLYSKGSYPVDQRIARRHKNGLNILWADMHVDYRKQAFMAAGKGTSVGYYYNAH
jgi:prepilin-type N-terminal cleavage/methylation domain-containing protein/prepilin-type processing-associated H-X9-DG protein